MVHSIELVPDDDTEHEIARQWRSLAEAGLPSEQRTGPPSEPSATPRRPHLTLVACAEIDDQQADAAGALAAGALPLPVVVGAPMIFGSARSRRAGLILVRQVPARMELLGLQQRVLAACPPPVDRNFSTGRWAPHVTLARRLAPDQVGEALRVLAQANRGSPPEIEGRLVGCRLWRGDLKQARQLAAGPGS